MNAKPSTPIRLRRDEVRQVDALAIERLGMPGPVLMENAGRNAAELIAAWVPEVGAQRVIIFSGPGNNGGDGFVIARHLRIRGIECAVSLVGSVDRLTPDAELNYQILIRSGVEIPALSSAEALQQCASGISPIDVVVDALLGTGFQGDVREPLAGFLNALNGAPKALAVAIDVPSGLDCDTGKESNAVFRAQRTITFVAEKLGFTTAGAITGEVYVADIGAPVELVEEVVASRG